jgi:hypothetical protein
MSINDNKINRVLEDNNNFKEMIKQLNNQIQKYKIENLELLEQNNNLNSKLENFLNMLKKKAVNDISSENISNYKNKTDFNNDDYIDVNINEITENPLYSKSNNNYNMEVKDSTVINGSTTSINNKDYSDNSLLFMNKEIDNLNKRNEETFKIIYKNSKLFQEK